MKKKEKKEEEKEEVICVRLNRPVAVEKHRRCPYCFGKLKDIKSKKHKKFCDYKKGKDSKDFGFPFD